MSSVDQRLKFYLTELSNHKSNLSSACECYRRLTQLINNESDKLNSDQLMEASSTLTIFKNKGYPFI
jgi:hypothetical protein